MNLSHMWPKAEKANSCSDWLARLHNPHSGTFAAVIWQTCRPRTIC